jgi:ERCC4-type nuclease
MEPKVFSTHGFYRKPFLANYNSAMANLVLVYGMRLLPSDEIEQIGDAVIKLKNGREARVTMHVLEGSKEAIEKQLRTSTESFFDMYPEI